MAIVTLVGLVQRQLKRRHRVRLEIRLAGLLVLALGCRDYVDERPAEVPTAPVRAALISPEPAACVDHQWTLMSTGFSNACAKSPDGLKCWGTWSNGLMTVNSAYLSFGGSTAAKSVASGADHTCAAVDSGVWCWGSNGYGQLGTGDLVNSFQPKRVNADFGDRVIKLSSTAYNTCALLSNGEVWCWGANHGFQSGVGGASFPTVVLTPAKVDMSGRNAKDLALGGNFGCVIADSGEILCWGTNDYGQLGRAGGSSAAAVVATTGSRRALTIGVTTSSACAAFDDSSTACWGYNRYGELGNGNNTNQTLPVNIDLHAASTPIQIDGGREHMCILLKDNTMRCWGKNTCWETTGPQNTGNLLGGQLGLGQPNSISPNTPQLVQLPAGKLPVKISAGLDNTCASFDDGSVRCWGCDGSGLVNAGENYPSSSASVAQVDQYSPAAMGELKVALPTPGACPANTPPGALSVIDVCRLPSVSTSANPPPDEAVFIYENRGTQTIETTLGVDNQFSGTQDRGQPRSFPPGKGAFRLSLSPNDTTSWTLGPKTLSATSSAPVCQLLEKGVQDEVFVNGKVFRVPPTTRALQPEPPVGDPYNGALAGSFAVSPSGAATYTVPIAIPPGIQGIAPALSLVYNSQEGDGIAGQGWSLAGLSQISRCPKTMLVDHRSSPVALNNDDALCLDGKRLHRQGTGEHAKFYLDAKDFSTITQQVDTEGMPVSFSIETKDGVVHRYASRSESAVKIGDTIAIWLLDEVRDVYDNWYQIHYNDDQQDFLTTGIRVTSIKYTGKGELNPRIPSPDFRDSFASVDFFYEDRPDQRFTFLAGVSIWRKQRLKTIKTARGQYGLVYKHDEDESLLPSRLEEITYESGGMSPVSLKFDWDWAEPSFPAQSPNYELPVGIDIVTYYSADAPAQQKSGAFFADINGDGLTDLVQSIEGKPSRSWRNTGSGWDEDATLKLPDGFFLYRADGIRAGAGLYDWDGDGLMDVVDGGEWKVCQVGETCHAMRVWLNRTPFGQGWLFQDDASPTYTVRQNPSDPFGPRIPVGDSKVFANSAFLSLDGDAKIDRIDTKTGKSVLNGRPADQSYDLPPAVALLYPDESWRVSYQDVDGDGLTDILVRQGAPDPIAANWTYDMWRNTGHDETNPTQNRVGGVWELKTVGALPQLATDFYRVFNADINGDGRPDVVQFSDVVSWDIIFQGQPTPKRELYTNEVRYSSDWGLTGSSLPTDRLPEELDGNSLFYVKALPAPIGTDVITRGGQITKVVQVSDLNGDGLADLIRGPADVALNNGSGWRPSAVALPIVPEIATPPAPYLYMGGNKNDNGARFFDLNGDGMPDLIRAEGGNDHQAWLNAARPVLITNFPKGLANKTVATYQRITTRPGRGESAFTQVLENDAKAHFAAAPIYVVTSVKEDTGISGDSPSGVRDYKYRGFKVSSEGLGPFGFRTVTVEDQISGIRTETTYSQVFPYVGQVLRTKRFEISTGKQLSQSDAIYCDAQSATDTSPPPPCDPVDDPDQPLGQPKGRPYSPDFGDTRFVSPASVTDKSFMEGGASVSVTTSYRYDVFGNPFQTTVDTQGSNGDHSEQVTTLSFIGDLEAERRGKPQSITVKTWDIGNSRAPLSHKTTFQYDPVTWAEIERRTEAGLGVPFEVRTATKYDNFGNIIRTVVCADDLDNCTPDATGPSTPNAVPYRITETSFKIGDFAAVGAPLSPSGYLDGRFPVRTSDTNGHVQYFVYDPLLGEKIQETSSDGFHTRRTFDPLGNPTTVTTYAGTSRASTTTFSSFLATTADAPAAASVTIARPPTGSPSWTYTDRLGRKVATISRSFEGGFVETISEFDRHGMLTRASAPSKDSPPRYWTTTKYDVLGRVQRIDQDVGNVDGTGEKTITTEVNTLGFATTTTKSSAGVADQRQTLEVHDARGKIVSVSVPTDPKDLPTYYSYDSEGNLTCVGSVASDPCVEAMTSTVWLHGRRDSSQDTDVGNWQYHYNGFGAPIEEVNNGVSTFFKYDEVGRLSARVAPDGTSTWYYDDNPGPANGKLKAVIGPPDDRFKAPCPVPGIGFGGDGNRAAKWFEFDSFGQIKESFECIDGEVFSVRQTYDAFGRTETLQYPEVAGRRVGVRYRYNPSGYLADVSDLDTGAIQWAARETNSRNDLVRDDLGNGLETSSDRNSATGWLKSTSITPRAGGPSLATGTYTFDPFGNLSHRVQTVGTSQSEDGFTYDEVERVKTVHTFAQGAPLSADEFDYDSLGNLTKKNGKRLYYQSSPTCSGLHQLCNVDGEPINVYDSAGNLRQDATHSVKYNSRNKVIHIERTATAAVGDVPGALDILYGGADSRVAQETTDARGAKSRTLYVGLDNVGHGLYERTARGGIKEHVLYLYAPGAPEGAIALRVLKQEGSFSTETLRFYHRDHLGSVIAVSDESGALAKADDGSSAAVSYDTWGAQRGVDGSAVDNRASKDLPGRRGFTGHEYVATVGLVNMNGRVYDPRIGRFLSADPNVQFSANLQSYNRYSYALNNPLRYTDPTGYVIARYSPSTSWWSAHGESVIQGVALTAWCVVTAETGGTACAALALEFAAMNTAVAISDGASPAETIAVGVISVAVSIAASGVGDAATSWWQAALRSAATSAATAAVMGVATGNFDWRDILIDAGEAAVVGGFTFVERARVLSQMEEAEASGRAAARSSQSTQDWEDFRRASLYESRARGELTLLASSGDSAPSQAARNRYVIRTLDRFAAQAGPRGEASTYIYSQGARMGNTGIHLNTGVSLQGIVECDWAPKWEVPVGATPWGEAHTHPSYYLGIEARNPWHSLGQDLNVSRDSMTNSYVRLTTGEVVVIDPFRQLVIELRGPLVGPRAFSGGATPIPTGI